MAQNQVNLSSPGAILQKVVNMFSSHKRVDVHVEFDFIGLPDAFVHLHVHFLLTMISSLLETCILNKCQLRAQFDVQFSSSVD